MEIVQKYFSDFTDTQLWQLGALKNLYEEWNQKINVISRKDLDNFYLHHVLHSLSIAAVFDFAAGMEVMDLGTGGGFPGIPLSILFPEVNFLLVDSISKKLKVVQAVVESIGLKNITVMHTRAEDIHNKKFDVMVSRAVAPLKDLWRWSKPLLRKNTPESSVAGGLICLKGGDLHREISESGCRPRIYEIEKIFEEEYFRGKYILQVT
ncbi:MAG TPA: 16S rRNA (guanine(527)-N(7))-methyltransferase RsmG [Chitinophagaceae bacterium]|nr:16S rRNA (guanine(527)-N(7))-methyltransferase RsmG [Chitinophagaceae bacterium]